MGKRIELDYVYRPPGSAGGEGASAGVRRSAEAVQPPRTGKRGRKAKIELPPAVKEWMDAHGLRAVPKVARK